MCFHLCRVLSENLNNVLFILFGGASVRGETGKRRRGQDTEQSDGGDLGAGQGGKAGREGLTGDVDGNNNLLSLTLESRCPDALLFLIAYTRLILLFRIILTLNENTLKYF